ncbi:rhodanese-like domain-containing protein [Euzebyella marina]|uniref:Rhodanese-like domain-containing protein n=1 Tax=Euzebyella marina TaxID=1761453 RepID=A0A3G2L9W2_9FLAO|nr:rhodanese-like domain-containing protein [Euzebyella marina]AYN69037.1 rhodanese-like domain-containing protein [Euzebyella marina]
MKYMVTFLFLITCNLGCTQSNSKPITELSQKDRDSGILLDVRTPEEFAEGHLDGAVNLNWFEDDFKEKATKLNKNKPIYLYCKAGGRSAKAAEAMGKMGFEVVNLEGGYDAYLQRQQSSK